MLPGRGTALLATVVGVLVLAIWLIVTTSSTAIDAARQLKISSSLLNDRAALDSGVRYGIWELQNDNNWSNLNWANPSTSWTMSQSVDGRTITVGATLCSTTPNFCPAPSAAVISPGGSLTVPLNVPVVFSAVLEDSNGTAIAPAGLTCAWSYDASKASLTAAPAGSLYAVYTGTVTGTTTLSVTSCSGGSHTYNLTATPVNITIS